MQPTSPGNPFSDIISKFQERASQGQQPQGAPMGPQGGQMPSGPHMMPHGQMMGGVPTDEEQTPNQLQRGETGDNTQNLLKAVTAVQGYIANSTNPQEIAVARSIVVLMSKLISLDQENARKALDQGGTPQGQPPQA